MYTEHAVALSIFASYFLLIIAVFALIVRSLPKPSQNNGGDSGKLALFFGLTIASFAHTWYYMIHFMLWSFSEFAATGAVLSPSSPNTPAEWLAEWLVNTSLFEQAWSTVSFGVLNWCWSEQICLFTVGAWTVFLYTEGQQRGVKYVWAYMLLGQIVAISVAVNLFHIALIRAGPADRRRNVTPSPMLLGCVALSLATVAISPHASERTFLPNLLVMHSLLILPLIFPGEGGRLPTSTLYRAIGAVAVLIRARTLYVAFSTHPANFLEAMWETLHSHPAQASIGWDVVWTSLSFSVWIFVGSGEQYVKSLLEWAPIFSIGVSAPLVLGSENAGLEHGRED